MRFAEVFLRLGTALVAWMMLFAYTLWLAAAYVVGCGPDGDEMHRLLLGLAPFTCGFVFLTRVTRPFADIHAMLRWLGVPIGLLSLLGLRTIWSVAVQVNKDGAAICGEATPAFWELAWAPVQLFALLLIGIVIAAEMKRAH